MRGFERFDQSKPRQAADDDGSGSRNPALEPCGKDAALARAAGGGERSPERAEQTHAGAQEREGLEHRMVGAALNVRAAESRCVSEKRSEQAQDEGARQLTP